MKRRTNRRKRAERTPKMLAFTCDSIREAQAKGCLKEYLAIQVDRYERQGIIRFGESDGKEVKEVKEVEEAEGTLVPEESETCSGTVESPAAPDTQE